jgi:hypothetical protein
MARPGRSCAAVTLVAVAVTLGGCTTSVAGKAMRAGGKSTAPMSARDLLLKDGDRTPVGVATATPVGVNYFTSARPPECSAALLFEGSPLRPPGSSDHAETAYRVDGQALYAESVDVYGNTLNTEDVVWRGFRAVSECRGDAVGVSPTGEFKPMSLSGFGIPEDGVLSWTMTRPDWTCDYGWVVVPRVALLISACDAKPGFPMADWASTRKAQINGQRS